MLRIQKPLRGSTHMGCKGFGPSPTWSLFNIFLFVVALQRRAFHPGPTNVRIYPDVG